MSKFLFDHTGWFTQPAQTNATLAAGVCTGCGERLQPGLRHHARCEETLRNALFTLSFLAFPPSKARAFYPSADKSYAASYKTAKRSEAKSNVSDLYQGVRGAETLPLRQRLVPVGAHNTRAQAAAVHSRVHSRLDRGDVDATRQWGLCVLQCWGSPAARRLRRSRR